jgi:predicted metalloprotease
VVHGHRSTARSPLASFLLLIARESPGAEFMRWGGLRRSQNVRDLRGRRGGIGMPLRIGGRGGGIATIILLVVAVLFGGPEMLSLLVGDGTMSSVDGPAPVANDETGQFVAAVLGSTEDVWSALFAADGASYDPPELTLFSGAVDSACGFAGAAVGPFYCPADRRVYLDTSFFEQLARMGGAGDFAEAYVIGHEVGHHVQTLTGTAARVRNAQSRAGTAASNQLQVAMELQADCYAGVWAHHANREQRVLEPGDVEEGLAAAAAIGDDTLQREAGRRVTPEAFTHGSAEQRQRWLETGLESGAPASCNPFE